MIKNLLKSLAVLLVITSSFIGKAISNELTFFYYRDWRNCLYLLSCRWNDS